MKGGGTAVPAFMLMTEAYLTDEYAPETVAPKVGISAARIRELAADLAAVAGGGPEADVRLSAHTGDGEADLVRALLAQCGALGEQPLLLALNERQVDLAATAAAALQRSDAVAAQGLPWDFWTIDLREAIQCLGAITGEELTESVLDRIFSRFCIGK